MAYIKRVSDGRIFEVFGTDLKSLPLLFFVYDKEMRPRWTWIAADRCEPLEELVLDEEEDDEDEGDDNDLHLPIPPKEDKL